MVSSIWGHAAGEPLGVVYPESESRDLEKVFDTIIDGIEEETRSRIDKYSLEESFDLAKLKSDITGNENSIIIALGPRSREAMRKMDLDIPVVLGEIFHASIELDKNEITGISPFPDTTILLKKLTTFAPYVRKVLVVYNPDKHQSLINDALESAKQIGLTVDARPARDILSSAPIYQELADTMDASNAIWLHSNIEDSIFEDLLRKAWDRRFIVFSNNNMGYVKRGALFSMVPDDFQMGRELGKLAVQVQANPVRTGVARLKSLNTAVNKKAADHLDIDLDRDWYDWLF